MLDTSAVAGLRKTADEFAAKPRVTAAELHALAERMFSACGVPAADAAIAAEVSVYAQLHGSEAHGVLHMPLYVTGLLDKTIKATPRFAFSGNLPTTQVLEADNGLGLVASRRAIDSAIALARTYGMGAVAVRNSSHCGVMGYYVEHAAEQGMVGMAFSNAMPAMAATGGREALFGTNPIAAGFPRHGAKPIVPDLATTVVARSRIRQMLTQGQQLPEGWALDPDGKPTTDPAVAVKGTVLPIGGPKGYALGLMVEMLCSAFSDGQPGFEVTYENMVKRPSGVGHFFLVLNPAGFVPVERFDARVSHIAKTVEGTKRLEGAPPPRLPGARGQDLDARYRAEGIPMTAVLAQALKNAAALFEKYSTA